MTRASLSTIVRQYFDGLAGREPPLLLPRVILVALSGGPDSMALVEVLARLAPQRTPPLTIVAHGVDHGLRTGAAGELDLAARFCDRLGVPFERTSVTVPEGGNLQARARDARWAALVAAARRHGAAVATGHHADDRAETLLLRLLRGAGLRGLAVLPPDTRAPGAEDVLVLRPVLRARRVDVEAHVERHAIPHVRDPSNADPRHLRTRVRLHVLPLLTELDPAIVTHLEAIADERLNDAPRPAGLEWAARLPRPTQTALAALQRSQSPTARVWLPGGLVAIAEPRKRRRKK